MKRRAFGLLFLVCLAVSAHAGRLSGQAGDDAPWHEVRQLRARVQQGDTGEAVVLRASELELAVGRPDRARALLQRLGGEDEWGSRGLAVAARAEYDLGAFERSARLFGRAAAATDGSAGGILSLRAGDAFEKAGLPEEAHIHYDRAIRALPEIAGWVAIRLARTQNDTLVGLPLLRGAAAAGLPLAARARARLLLGAGDSSGAVRAFQEAGLNLDAAQILLSVGDTGRARSLTYQVLEEPDTSDLRGAFRLAGQAFPPASEEELLSMAQAARRLRLPDRATRLASAAAARPEPSDRTLLFWADLLDGNGAHERALSVYARVAKRGGATAPVAAYRRARLLGRMGRVTASSRALTDFAAEYPDDALAPAALFVVAERRGRTQADSLHRVIAAQWPRDTYASRSRIILASNALSRSDTATARAWYRLESDLGADQQYAAQYQLASLVASRGDSVEAKGMWAALARADSLGYYGMIARRVAGLPPLRIDPGAARSTDPEARAQLRELDLLREANLLDEAELLVSSILTRRDRPPAVALDLAEGLIERGFTAEGIRLGWIAARAYTLNHPRVLRVIFPWPLRALMEEEARKSGVDPYLLAGLVRQESAFRRAVVSRAGAVGIMQLMPSTAQHVARQIGVGWDQRLLTVADANLHVGVSHFANLLRQYDGDVVPALAAYNAGGTPVRRWLRYPEAGDPVQFVERIPYVETRGYLRTVLRNRSLYRALYPDQVGEGRAP